MYVHTASRTIMCAHKVGRGFMYEKQTKYGVASVSRIDKIICLICKRAR